MLADRLPLLIAAGALTLPPEGRIAVIGPRAGTDLSALPKERVEVVARHYPDHRWFAQQGYATALEPAGPYVLAIVVLPRAKAEAQAAIAAARAATEGPLVVDGQKTDGIDAMVKALRARAGVTEVISKAHGKICLLEGGDFTDWRAAPMRADGFATAPGVFSADAVDPGSAALIAALPPRLKGRVVDLGAGWGVLAAAALDRGAEAVDLVEADHAALEAARANVTDPRARFHWADARDFRPETPADHVLCNPPFHAGRSPDPALGQAFVRNAASILAPRGTLWLVANRHLPYEKTLEACFASVETLQETAGYKIIRADKPRPHPKG